MPDMGPVKIVENALLVRRLPVVKEPVHDVLDDELGEEPV